MEVNINERRQSAAVPPPWLEPKLQPFANVFAGAVSPQEGPSRHPSLVPPIGPGAKEDGYQPPLVAAKQAAGSVPSGANRMNVPQLVVATPAIVRHRLNTEPNYADTEVDELLAMLRETESIEEQGDILQYLVDTQGLDFNTGTKFFLVTFFSYKIGLFQIVSRVIIFIDLSFVVKLFKKKIIIVLKIY